MSVSVKMAKSRHRIIVLFRAPQLGELLFCRKHVFYAASASKEAKGNQGFMMQVLC